jgi:hypothetical protein
MAVQNYVLTADVTVPAGTASPVSGGMGIVSYSGQGPYPRTYPRGSVISLDPAGSLYAAIGAGNLRAFADTDAVGHGGLAN